MEIVEFGEDLLGFEDVDVDDGCELWGFEERRVPDEPCPSEEGEFKKNEAKKIITNKPTPIIRNVQTISNRLIKICVRGLRTRPPMPPPDDASP